MKIRVAIPDDLAAEVMFRSDRICCVCKIVRRKTQIHHIDSDPSNNVFENLALLCGDCHSEAHTTHAFARNLTPELIRTCNEHWRAVVSLRLALPADAARQLEYQQRVLLELSLICHGWKVHYMSLYPGNFLRPDGRSVDGEDVWGMMIRVASHPYTKEEWQRYLLLFTDGINAVATCLDQLLMAHGEVVSVSLKLAVLQTNSQLRIEQQSYLLTPQLSQLGMGGETILVSRFHETIRTISTFEKTHNKPFHATRDNARA